MLVTLVIRGVGKVRYPFDDKVTKIWSEQAAFAITKGPIMATPQGGWRGHGTLMKPAR